MSSSMKKAARELSKEMGIPYQAAFNQLMQAKRAKAAAVGAPGPEEDAPEDESGMRGIDHELVEATLARWVEEDNARMAAREHRRETGEPMLNPAQQAIVLEAVRRYHVFSEDVLARGVRVIRVTARSFGRGGIGGTIDAARADAATGVTPVIDIGHVAVEVRLDIAVALKTELEAQGIPMADPWDIQQERERAVANGIRARAAAKAERQQRFVTVVQDFETSQHAGAGGMFQVISLEEWVDGETIDVTDLVDQGIHFRDIEHFEAYLAQLYPAFDFVVDAEAG